MDFTELKNFLLEKANYEDKQWREIKAICDIRQGAYSASASAEKEVAVEVGDEWTRMFYGRLTEVLLYNEKIAMAPLGVLKRMQPKQYANVRKIAALLHDLSLEWNPSKVRGRNFTVGVMHLYCKLTVQYLRDCSVPISAKAVLQHGDKFVGLVNRSFPGYVKSGLIHLVVLGKNAA